MSNANDFNSHAHVERDYYSNNGRKRNNHFNSHAHVERDTGRVVFTEFNGISTHTLTWSVTYIRSDTMPTITFQLTRSRGA